MHIPNNNSIHKEENVYAIVNWIACLVDQKFVMTFDRLFVLLLLKQASLAGISVTRCQMEMCVQVYGKEATDLDFNMLKCDLCLSLILISRSCFLFCNIILNLLTKLDKYTTKTGSKPNKTTANCCISLHSLHPTDFTRIFIAH